MIINKFCLGDFDHRKSTWCLVKIFQQFHRLFGFFSKLNLSRALTASLTISWKVWCEHWTHKTNKHIHLETFKVPRFSFSNIWDESRHSHILVCHSTSRNQSSASVCFQFIDTIQRVLLITLAFWKVYLDEAEGWRTVMLWNRISRIH